MPFTQQMPQLTDKAVLAMLHAGIAKASDMKQPQCLVIVDASGQTLSTYRMVGAKFLSISSARAKALTAASIRGPSHTIPNEVHSAIALATKGDVTGLPGGLPIIIGGQCLGGVGIGSGSGDQDIAVANAMLSAVNGELF